MKRLAWAAAAAAILFGAAYLGSPLLAWRSLQDAARSGDELRMQQAIDFARVRDGLKAQLQPMFAARIHADPALRGNPYAGLGLSLLPGLIGRMVDAYLTPQSIALMVAQAHPPAADKQIILLSKPVDLTVRYAYLGLDAFRVTAAAPARPDLAMEFLLQRRGLFRWTLVRIGLPAKALG